MGVGGFRCRWVRDRLPLRAGGELRGPDRRRVERHLITCPGCRDHERSLSRALAALHAAAAGAPPAADPAGSPSLWPALQRQIREAKHAPRPSPLSLGLAFPWPGVFAAPGPARPRLRAALLLAGALTVAVVGAWSRRQ